MTFKVVDTHEGEEKFFQSRVTAKAFQKSRREHLHQKYCIEKSEPTHCLCTETNHKEMCASHHFIFTVRDHPLKECPLKEDVGIAEIKID